MVSKLGTFFILMCNVHLRFSFAFILLFLIVESHATCRYKSTGGVGTIKEYVGYSEDHHWYMVTMIPHNKGNARRVQERSISRCFSGYSSFDDVLNADERRKRRRLEERSRVKHLSAANKEHRKEIKNLQRQARSLEEELSVGVIYFIYPLFVFTLRCTQHF